MQILFPHVQASFVDGRGQSTRHKQAQFHRLFDAATGAAHAIKLALQADSGNSLAEVDLEFSLTLSSLKQYYNTLQLEKQLHSDRQIERGKGNAERRRPLGIVYIIPSKLAPFYSIVSAWAAATAAGCPVILELPRTLSQTSSAFRQLFQRSLDTELFALSDSRPPAEFTQQCTLVNQTEEDVDVTSWARVLQAPAQSTSVAVVSRSADIGATAKTIATAGFAFGGKSPYSPHLVLVNEFVADLFLAELVSHVARPLFEAKELSKTPNGRIATATVGSGSEKNIERLPHAKIIASGANGRVVELLARTSYILERASEGATIFVHRVKSPDDTIGLLDEFQCVSALYLFGSPSEANYVSAYSTAFECFVNHVPGELMLGPLAPAFACSRSKVSSRYDGNMFSTPQPQYLPSSSTLMASILDQPVELKRLCEAAVHPLPQIKQANGGVLGFFRQGILIGLGMVTTVVVGGSAGLVWVFLNRRRLF